MTATTSLQFGTVKPEYFSQPWVILVASETHTGSTRVANALLGIFEKDAYLGNRGAQRGHFLPKPQKFPDSNTVYKTHSLDKRAWLEANPGVRIIFVVPWRHNVPNSFRQDFLVPYDVIKSFSDEKFVKYLYDNVSLPEGSIDQGVKRLKNVVAAEIMVGRYYVTASPSGIPSYRTDTPKRKNIGEISEKYGIQPHHGLRHFK